MAYIPGKLSEVESWAALRIENRKKVKIRKTHAMVHSFRYRILSLQIDPNWEVHQSFLKSKNTLGIRLKREMLFFILRLYRFITKQTSFRKFTAVSDHHETKHMCKHQ